MKAATFHLPPLRERLEDLDALVAFWLPCLSAHAPTAVRGLTSSARDCLRRYRWPGNVRELYHALELAIATADGDLLTDEDLGPEFGVARRLGSAPRLDGAPGERDRVLSALERHRWNASQAAKSLGVNRKTLWRWRQRLSL